MTTTANCRVSFIDFLFSIFYKLEVRIFTPYKHSNFTAIVLSGTITEPGLPVVILAILRCPSVAPCWVFVFPSIRPFQENFQRPLRHRRVDFGVTFSIIFLSFSALLGLRKNVEQDAMSSLVSVFRRRKVQNGYA